MAGIKGKSGGKREGAGRKKNPPDKLNGFDDIEEVYPQMQKNLNPLSIPKEIAKSKYAREAWEYVIKCDENSKIHLLNERHLEAVKSYCLAVAIRQRLIETWQEQKEAVTTFDSHGNVKINPVIVEIEKKSRLVNEFAEDLALTVMSEYKMAREAESGKTLNGAEEEKEDSLFD